MVNAKVVIATHGKMASGILDTLELLGVNRENIETMGFYGADGLCEKDITVFVESLDENKEIFVFTDIAFGSVNQLFFKEKLRTNKKNLHIISGVNLPLIMSVCLESGDLNEDKIQELVTSSKEQIIYYGNDFMKSAVTDNNEMFEI